MAAWLGDPQIVAAIVASISGFIAGLIGAIVSLYNSQLQIRAQVEQQRDQLTEQARNTHLALEEQAKERIQDLQLRTKAGVQELEVFSAGLLAQQQLARQVQLTEVLKKRIETYPILYEIIATYGRNWGIEGKERDREWATSFLMALIKNNAKNGAFLSEAVYQWYSLLRTFLEVIARLPTSGRNATEVEVSLMEDIIRGPRIDLSAEKNIQAPGLGSLIKDELGSYITATVSATHRFVELQAREPYQANSDLDRLARLLLQKRIERLMDSSPL